MTNSLVLVGAALSLGLIAVSVILNFRVAYRGADTEFDAWIYGLTAGMADGLKAFAPFAIHVGWRNRDWLAVVTASMLFIAITSYTFSAEFGFAAQHRMAKQGERIGATEKRGDLRNDYERIDRRIAAMGVQRSGAEISKAIEAVYARPVGEKGRTVDQVSSRCTLNRKDSREACAEIAALDEEAARAQEFRRLSAQAQELRSKLDGYSAGPGGGSGDPQLDSVQQLAAILAFKVDRKSLETGLSLMVAVIIELGSGVGLYVSTTPWRTVPEPTTGPGGSGRGRGLARLRRGMGRWWKTRVAQEPLRERDSATMKSLGDVDAYMVDRIEPRAGVNVDGDELFDDYVVWCRWRGNEPYRREVFEIELISLARVAGISVARPAGSVVLDDVGLVGR